MRVERPAAVGVLVNIELGPWFRPIVVDGRHQELTTFFLYIKINSYTSLLDFGAFQFHDFSLGIEPFGNYCGDHYLEKKRKKEKKKKSVSGASSLTAEIWK